MATLKERLPNRAAVEARCQVSMRERYESVSQSTKLERARVQELQRNFIVPGVSALSALMTLFFTTHIIVVGVVIVSAAIFLWYFIAWQAAMKLYERALHSALLPIMSEVLGTTISYFERTLHSEETENLFKKSELITEGYDNIKTDGMFSSSEPYTVLMSELEVTQVISQEKTTETKTLFHGLFTVVTLPKILTGVTFISTEGDTQGFGHRSFWTNLLKLGPVKETQLEWNEFEKDLHVATTSGTEARYILTPNFMEQLHTWWQERKENIRLVFRDNRLYIILPDREVKIALAGTIQTEESMRAYITSIVMPMWRTLTLIEDIRF